MLGFIAGFLFAILLATQVIMVFLAFSLFKWLKIFIIAYVKDVEKE